MTRPSLAAVGVGCRKGAEASDIAILIGEALAGAGRGPKALFTIAHKRGEPGLAAAAAMMGVPLVFLPHAALAATAERCATRSEAALARFGLPSVAEAAALAGAGPGSRLLAPRRVRGGATCALAVPAEDDR